MFKDFQQAVNLGIKPEKSWFNPCLRSAFLVTPQHTCWSRLVLPCEVLYIFMGRSRISLVRISDQRRGMEFHLGLLANELLSLIPLSLKRG